MRVHLPIGAVLTASQPEAPRRGWVIVRDRRDAVKIDDRQSARVAFRANYAESLNRDPQSRNALCGLTNRVNPRTQAWPANLSRIARDALIAMALERHMIWGRDQF